MNKYIFFIITLLQFLSLSSISQAAKDRCEIDLKGEWFYAVDMADEGVLKKWYLGNFQDTYLGNINIELDKEEKYNFIPSFTDRTYLPNTSDLMKIGLPDQSPWINYLQRKHKYMGAVWFQKIVDIPEDYLNKNIELYLERVKWQSRVWVDGIEVVSSPQDGLVTPHRHKLGKLNPGKHLISIRVDNRMIHPIGDKGHNYTEQTESIWNGIIGEIKLVSYPEVYFEDVQVYSNIEEKTVSARFKLINPTNDSYDVDFSVLLSESNNATRSKKYDFKRKVEIDTSNVEITFKPFDFKLWSSNNPNLYNFKLFMTINDSLKQQSENIVFGNRDISTSKYKIVVNGNPEFIRGNQEALGFPPTGHPPVDIETWRMIFKKYKEYGLNQVRFHSSTPPKAAFQAADELGIYIMAELVWMTSINAKNDLRPISATTGVPQGLGNADRTIDDFVYSEAKRLFREFGNHPSFAFFSFGNEMDNINKDLVNKWISEFKQDDNRRLYAATTARAILEADDFQDSHIVPGIGQVVNKDDYNLMHNYDSVYIHSNLPVIAHELGQFPSHPVWSDIDKYEETPFRFINLEKASIHAKHNNVYDCDEDFQYASGKFQLMLYKSEIERQFRSKYSAGFNLLQMNDYTGQGEALVGWLDAFYDEKNYANPEEVKQFSNELVILAEFEKRIFGLNENFTFSFMINNSCTDIKSAGIIWEILDENGEVVKDGKLSSKILSLAVPTHIGESQIIFDSTFNDGKYVLRAYTHDRKYSNSWEVWLYKNEEPTVGEVYVTSNLRDAINKLSEGRRVLLFVDKSVKNGGEDFASFKPVFWSTLFFPGKGSKTLGALIDNRHAVFNSFPTDGYLNWNWKDIARNGSGFILSDELKDLNPIVQPINDFHTSFKLASLVEAKVGEGKLIISGYNLTNDLQSRPAAKKLYASILKYMNSESFSPKVELDNSTLIKNFTYNENDKSENISMLFDNILVNMPQFFKVEKKNINTFEFTNDRVIIGRLRMKFESETEFKTIITIEDRSESFDINRGETWAELQIFREDFDDQKFIVNFDSEVKDKISEIEVVID